MQEYKKTMIGKDQIVPIAERMRKNEVWLTMIHASMSWERPSCPRSAVSMT